MRVARSRGLPGLETGRERLKSRKKQTTTFSKNGPDLLASPPPSLVDSLEQVSSLVLCPLEALGGQSPQEKSHEGMSTEVFELQYAGCGARFRVKGTAVHTESAGIRVSRGSRGVERTVQAGPTRSLPHRTSQILPSPYLCHSRGKQRTEPRRHNSELVRLAQFLSKHQALWSQADVFTPQRQPVCCTCIVIPATPPTHHCLLGMEGRSLCLASQAWLGAGLGGLIPTGCECFFTGGSESHRTPQGRRVNLHFL